MRVIFKAAINASQIYKLRPTDKSNKVGLQIAAVLSGFYLVNNISDSFSLICNKLQFFSELEKEDFVNSVGDQD